MKNKKILIISTGVLGIVGMSSLFLNTAEARTLYIIVSSVLLLTVALGGLIDYNSQHMRDFREIYREKYKMQAEREEILREHITKLTTATHMGELKNPAEKNNSTGNGGCGAFTVCRAK